jgi:hypothetical protein
LKAKNNKGENKMLFFIKENWRDEDGFYQSDEICSFCEKQNSCYINININYTSVLLCKTCLHRLSEEIDKAIQRKILQDGKK